MANLLRGFSDTFLKLSTGGVQRGRSITGGVKKQRGFRIASAWFQSHLIVVSESGAQKKAVKGFEIKREFLALYRLN
ncbi:MAG: hypothetical protein QM492_00970 [Rhodobacterales bacterium]